MAVLVIAAGLLSIAFSAVAIERQRVEVSQLRLQQSRAQAVQLDNLRLMVGMANQETGLRGYEATRLDVFLQPYRLGQVQVASTLGDLDRDARGTEFAADAVRVRSAALAWQAWARGRQAAVAQRGQPGIDEVQGKALFDGFRSANDRLDGLTTRTSAERRVQADLRDRTLNSTVINTTSLLALSLLLLGLLLIGFTLRPIGRLAVTAERMAAGERPTIAGLDRRDEVGALARALQRWNETENLARATIQHSPLGVVRIAPDGRLSDPNPALCTILGRSREELETLTFRDVTAPDHVARTEEMYETVRRTRAPATIEKQYLRPDNTRVWGQLTVALVGEGGGLVGLIADISERKQAEKRIRQTMLHQEHMVRELQALDRAKSEFVSTASHELRTPLTSIMGYTELLAAGDGGPLSEDQSMMVSTVDRNAKRLLSLVEDLLSLSRIEAGDARPELAPTDLASLVRAVVDGIRPAASARDIELELDLDANMPLVFGDRTQLDRAFLNVCSNAVKFTPRGGRVRVCGHSERNARGTWVVVRVEDTGIGIPEDEQRQVFDRFFRSRLAQRAAIQGTGLGLAIVKTIVEQHRGTIAIASAPGVGTSVTIHLPAGGT